MTNTTSQLSPPTLHWGTTGPDGDRCDLCRATIQPNADCFISIRRAFSIRGGKIAVEVEPIKVLMCVDCGWTRPYAPTPRETPRDTPDARNGLETANAATDGPTYHDAGVMDA